MAMYLKSGTAGVALLGAMTLHGCTNEDTAVVQPEATTTTTTSKPTQTDAPQPPLPAGEVRQWKDVVQAQDETFKGDTPKEALPQFGCPRNSDTLNANGVPTDGGDNVQDSVRGFYLYRALSEKTYKNYPLAMNNMASAQGVLGYILPEVVVAGAVEGYAEGCEKGEEGDRDCCTRKYDIDRIARYWVMIDNTRGKAPSAGTGPNKWGDFYAADCGCLSGDQWQKPVQNSAYPVGCQDQAGDTTDRGFGAWYTPIAECPSRIYPWGCGGNNPTGCETDDNGENMKKSADDWQCRADQPGGLCRNLLDSKAPESCTMSYLDAGFITMDELEGVDGGDFYQYCMDNKIDPANEWKNFLPPFSLYEDIADFTDDKTKVWKDSSREEGGEADPEERKRLNEWYKKAEQRIYDLFDNKYSNFDCMSSKAYSAPNRCGTERMQDALRGL